MDTQIRRTTPFIYLLTLLLALPALGQQQKQKQQQPQKLLYINGAVLEADSLQPLSGTTVKNASTGVDLLTDDEGLFQLRARPGDTLLIQHMTYMPTFYVIPTNLQGSSFAFVQLMRKEQVMEPVTIYSFPTQMQFEHALLQLDPPGNVTAEATELQYELDRVTNDPTRMQKYIDDYMRYQQMYVLPEQGLTEQGVPNNFLHPDRWRDFIRDWREGRFTQRGMEKLEGFPGELKDDDQ